MRLRKVPGRLWRAVSRRLPWSGRPTRADLVEKVDRNYHWLIHVDRRQQDLAVQVQRLREHLSAEVVGALDHVEHMAAARFDAMGADLAGVVRTSSAVAEQVAWAGAPAVADGPLVSVICATHDRVELMDRALASVRAQTYRRWECLIVDDGSHDVDAEVVRRWEADDRVRVLHQDHLGAAVARNRGLLAAEGEIVAYLDSDNTWHPTYLARVVDALDRDPQAQWTLASQLVVDGERAVVRADRYGIGQLADGNFMDVNAVAHRRRLAAEAPGPYGFDEEFTRLGDWDLVERLARVAGEPVRIPAVGSVYDERPGDRVTSRVPIHPHYHVLRRRGRGTPAAGLRVLVAAERYPSTGEHLAEADVAGLEALGAHVEAWSGRSDRAGPEAGVALHRGDLAAAVAAAQPDVVLGYGLVTGDAAAASLEDVGVPVAVRGRDVRTEEDRAALDRLLSRSSVMVHLSAHPGRRTDRTHPRLRRLPLAFDVDLFPPTPGKDHALVVQVATGETAEELDPLFEVASLCPGQRFVLVVPPASGLDGRHAAPRDHAGAPVEVVPSGTPEEVAGWIARAGLYLHGSAAPSRGLPLPVVEALATGSYVLVPDVPGEVDDLGEVVGRYRTAGHAAALVQQTARWDDDGWAGVWRPASDRAHTHFGAPDVAAAMLAQWHEVLGVRSPA